MQPDFDAFFQAYAETFNRALAGEPVFDTIMGHFTDAFIGAAPGVVNCGRNGEAFRAVLEQGYAFYRQIGTKRMNVRSVEATPIDPLHNMAKVSFRADYEKDGRAIAIDFDVTYLLQTHEDGPKIFAFISGDEMAAFREHGLVD